MSALGEALAALEALIASRRGADPAESYTASLVAAGPGKCAKKLGEEAVETVIALIEGEEAAIAAESADLLYHLLVALAARGVSLDAVAERLAARQGVSGHAEKAAR